jgi:DNA-binding winged helix-turn-helix (wHTH) protein
MSIVRFGSFVVDRASGDIRHLGNRVHIREQPLRLLLALVDHAGRIVTREQLRHCLWPDDVFVDFDRAINKAVSELRRVLGDSAGTPRYIETLSKRGYRFVFPVVGSASSDILEQSPIPQSDAHVACVTGRYLWNRRTVRDLHASIGHFEHALAVDERYAPAHAGLADAYALLGIWGLQPPETAFGTARRAAARALELNPNLAEGQTAFAEVLKDYEWSWHAAERRYQHAISLRPDYGTARQFYAQLLVSLGRHGEAALQIESAKRVDPVSPAINTNAPYIYLAGRQYARALQEALHAVELEPYSPLGHWQLGRAYLFSNHLELAVAALERATALAGALPMWEAELCFARARAGDRSGAMRLLAGLLERSQREYVSPYDLAVACAGVGDQAATLDHLERAFDGRVMRILGLGDPEFDDVRRTPRFARLLRRLALPRTPV